MLSKKFPDEQIIILDLFIEKNFNIFKYTKLALSLYSPYLINFWFFLFVVIFLVFFFILGN